MQQAKQAVGDGQRERPLRVSRAVVGRVQQRRIVREIEIAHAQRQLELRVRRLRGRRSRVAALQGELGARVKGVADPLGMLNLDSRDEQTVLLASNRLDLHERTVSIACAVSQSVRRVMAAGTDAIALDEGGGVAMAASSSAGA